ncbi:ChaN family lipoprotein [Pseudoalteromonas sp. MM17-2]|uniref:ChaN family lipoprotein n=1 Tax=Pseudoalteromonas sp. MM17-2 TaxID=2917753 RepID=UPI001EF47DCE|nr:ChaN family lipoprotein [Pseudoalteromonas sp. MM17-2]MCG7544967.1 ChaN family lipoprotein [Pseudoalteromonas sp. MM17-2]
MNKINKDVDYRKMAGNARLVLLAESSHSPMSYKYEAIKALKQLKAIGINYFAMEMLPIKLKEEIDHYQRTGIGLKKIKNFLDKNWNWNIASVTGYVDLIKTANSLGMKILPLDIPYELMDEYDKNCEWEKAAANKCDDSHIRRNDLWADILANKLKSDKNIKIVAFMHRYHAFKASDAHLGIDELMLTLNISQIRIIDYVGGLTCSTLTACEGESSEEEPLSQMYFVRKGAYVDSRVPSFTVHIPEKRLTANRGLTW